MERLNEIERIELAPGGRVVVLGWCGPRQASVGELSPGERAGLRAGATPKRAAEYVAGRAAAHRALAVVLGEGLHQVIARAAGPDEGRPVLSGGRGDEVAISISHSGGVAVAAVGWGEPLGADLEQLNEVRTGPFLEEAFAPGELAGYTGLFGAEVDLASAAFCIKEAVLKFWGVGLRAPLGKVMVRAQARKPHPNGLWLSLTIEALNLSELLPAPPQALDCFWATDRDHCLAVVG